MQVFVRSAVRIRPFMPTDQRNDVVCVSALPHLNQIVLSGHNCFTVDYALPVNFSQSQVFEVSVQPMVSSILQGYDLSVVVYGQANSGKTYTIFGPGLHCAFSEADYGIIPRFTREIFSQLMNGTRRHKVTITFIEIFGDSIRDLLGTNQVAPVLEEKNGRTLVKNVSEIECRSVTEVFNWLHVGMSSRHVPDHAVNAGSSCSHSVFTLFLEQEWVSNAVQQHVVSQAQFTDLAGSNSLFLKPAMEASGLQTLHYDNGLVAMENMIVALSDPRTEHNAGFYTNTALTRILKNSCGGTANTLVICCVSPLALDFTETLHSLKLAVQVRSVKNCLTLNVCSNTSTQSGNSPGKEVAEETAKIPEKPSGDVFGLSFAASQWLKLVASAENLFTELAANTGVSPEVKDQIEHWLCLKQECDECIESDRGVSDSVGEGRLLYRIDELTEPEEKNSSVVDGTQSMSSECGSSGVMCNSMFGSNAGFPDFSDKLDGCIKTFKDRTDSSVNVTEGRFVFENDNVQDTDVNQDSSQKVLLRELHNMKEGDQQDSDCCQEIPPKNLSARRNSICQGTISSKVIPPSGLELEDVSDASDVEKLEEEEGEMLQDHKEEVPAKPLASRAHSVDLPNVLKQLKLLTAESNGKQTKLQQVIRDLENSLKGIHDLKQCILMKEQRVGNYFKNELRLSLKNAQLNSNKIMADYLRRKCHGAFAENSLSSVDVDESKSLATGGKEEGKLVKLSQQCSKCHKEINDSEQTTVGAVKTILDDETSSHQMMELKMQLQKEVDLKYELEKEIAADKERIKELQEKYDERDTQMVESGQQKKTQWIQEEETRLINIQKSALQLHEELLQKQSLLEKREAFLKEKLLKEKSKSKDDADLIARSPHLITAVEEKLDRLEICSDRNETESLRREIQNLRITRQRLVDQLCGLDEKFQKDKTLSTNEERKLLECDEAIEAIDIAIEYKNQLMIGSKENELLVMDESGENEELLLARLMNLSPVEIRSLLCRYFKKVIDLRESGRKMEVQLAELDMQADAQTWKIHALSSALQQARVESERQMITLQREHDEKMHMMLRRITNKTDSDSDDESALQHYSRDIVSNLNKYKHENKNLKRRLQEMEAIVHVNNHGGVCDVAAGDENTCRSPVVIPRRNLKQLQGMQSPCTTKVTRQKNKLIIQQQQIRKPNQKR